MNDRKMGNIGTMSQSNPVTAHGIFNKIMKRLVSYGYKEDLMRLYVIGGGGCLLKNYTDVVDKEGVFFIDDICANAKGYEYLAMQKLKRAEKG